MTGAILPFLRSSTSGSLGIIFDLDAGLTASYSGSGQTFANRYAAPSDGEAQTDYDFYLGQNSASQSSDPVFNGSAGSDANTTYFSGSGGDDMFTLAAGNTDYLNALHQSETKFSFYAFMKAPTSLDASLFGTIGYIGSGTQNGISFSLGSDGSVRFHQGNGIATTLIASTAVSFIAGAESFLIGLSYNELTGNGLIYKKTSAGVLTTYSFTNRYVNPSTGSGSSMQIMASGGNQNPMPTLWRLWKSVLYNYDLTSADFNAIWDEYHSRKLA